jgi:3-oxoacyl-[acyl-carrier-protein] synthase II
MGIVSCLGNDAETFYQNLIAGSSGIQGITLFDCSDYPTKIAGEVKDFDAGDYIEKKQARRIDRSIAFCLVAGKKALAEARLYPEDNTTIDKTRVGCIIGSGIGGMTTFADNVQTLNEKGHRRVTPFLIPFILTNMGPALLAMDFGYMGPNYSISTACATSNNCIIAAAEHIRNGEADICLAGGSEAPLSPIGLAGFSALKALSERNEEPKRASRPFDKARDGFVMAEGAGVLVLEELEHALKRGAPIFAEYLGGGLSCDAHHMTDPRSDGAGVSLCIKKALHDAGISQEEVNYINAHGTSTPTGDMREVQGCLNIFSHPEKIVLNATKSMIGHSLGAAGAMEAIATIKMMQHKRVHPNVNLEDAEDIPFILPRASMPWQFTKALSNSFGFGGHNSSIVFGCFPHGG